MRAQRSPVFVPRATVTKYRKLGSLIQQKFIVLQFWKLEAQNQDVSQVMLA